MRRRVVLFELNEVPLRVVRQFADRHPQSAFAKFLHAGQALETITPDQGHLSPWTTWPTLHRGVDSTLHHIVALGQDVAETDQHYPPIWSLLAKAGRRVGMFGSLHSYPLPEDLSHYDFYLPDTFAATPETKPSSLSVFQSFNLQMVDRSGRNVSNGLPVKEGVSFLLKAVPSGLRPATVSKVIRQVASERIWRDRVGRRRTIQSLLAFDLFESQLRSKRPEAAFFFTNHVASSMHRYWPATFREDYVNTVWSDEWVRRFSGELDYTMGEADQMLSRLIDFADDNPEYVILVASSMGQAAVDSAEKQTKTEVLLRDMDRFLEQAGVSGAWRRRRTMEPTYTLAFEEPSAADAFVDAVSQLKIAGEPVAHRRLDPHGVEFVLGQANVAEEDFTVCFGNRHLDPAKCGLANVTIDDEVGAAAYHIPEGTLLTYDPQGLLRLPERSLSTTEIAPTLLRLLDVKPPAYMERPLELSVAGSERTSARVPAFS